MDIAFRMSDDSGYLFKAAAGFNNSAHETGPVTALTHSLATRPKLRTIRTLPPSIWNEALLRISANPALERVVLGDSRAERSSAERNRRVVGQPGDVFGHWTGYEVNPGVVGITTSLFFSEAKKHPRLCELIRAGTWVSFLNHS